MVAGYPDVLWIRWSDYTLFLGHNNPMEKNILFPFKNGKTEDLRGLITCLQPLQ